MRTLIFRAVSIVFLASSWALSDSPYDVYSPMDKGFEWVYDTLHKKTKDHFDMKVVIEGPWQEKGQSGMIMTQKDKRGRMREFLFKNDNGIFLYKLGLKKSISPEIDAKFTPDDKYPATLPKVIYPLEAGTMVEWQGQLKAAWVDKKIKFVGKVVGFEEIEVPAGKFKCIKLFYDKWQDKEHIEETAWYAEGVGQVKYDGGEYVKELKSFKKP